VVERSIRIRQVGGSMPPISKKNNFSAGSGIDARTLQIGGVSSSGRAADLHVVFC
jgi:hypothetical protein